MATRRVTFKNTDYVQAIRVYIITSGRASQLTAFVIGNTRYKNMVNVAQRIYFHSKDRMKGFKKQWMSIHLQRHTYWCNQVFGSLWIHVSDNVTSCLQHLELWLWLAACFKSLWINKDMIYRMYAIRRRRGKYGIKSTVSNALILQLFNRALNFDVYNLELSLPLITSTLHCKSTSREPLWYATRYHKRWECWKIFSQKHSFNLTADSYVVSNRKYKPSNTSLPNLCSQTKFGSPNHCEWIVKPSHNHRHF